MKRALFCLLLAVLAMPCPVRAQWTTPDNLPLGPQAQPTLELLPGGYCNFGWQGRQDRTYLVQFTSDLANWSYVPAVIPGVDTHQGMLLQSGANKLFFRLNCQDGITIDPNATELPDWWQLAYFGATGQAPNGDWDGDGISNLDEYKRGTSPVDFYNGVLYNVWITRGGDQQVAPGQYSAQPFSVSVNYGMTNAPVTFMAGEGGALLSATSGGALVSTLTVRTGSDGLASVYLYLPSDAPVNNNVTAYASTIEVTSTGGECQTLSVTTGVVKTDPNVAAPSDVSAVALSDESVRVSWTNNSDSGSLVETSTDGGATWQTAASVGPDVSSYDVTGLVPGQAVLCRVSSLSTSGGGGGGSAGQAGPSVQLGGGPPPPIVPVDDADPNDAVVNWRRTAEPRWAMIDLPVDGPDSLVFDDVSENGTALFSSTDYYGDAIIVDRSLQAHSVPKFPSVGIFSSIYRVLIGDRMVGNKEYKVPNKEDLYAGYTWDPIADTYEACPDFDGMESHVIVDSYDDFLVMDDFKTCAPRIVYGTPYGVLDDGDVADYYGPVARIEANGNVAGNILGTSHGSSVAYWAFDPNTATYGNPRTVTDDSTRRDTDSATIRETRVAGGNNTDVREWHVVVTDGELYVAQDQGEFAHSGVGSGKSPYYVGVGSHGWLAAETNDSLTSTQIWCDGAWKALSDLVSQEGGNNPDSIHIEKIRDNGVGVALVKYPEGQPKFMLMVPVEVEEMSPKLRDESDHIVPGSEIPKALPESNAMVERDPGSGLADASQIRIAWRDMKVKIGGHFSGKHVTWAMTPQFTPTQADGTPESAPRFRGDWNQAQNSNYKHPFSASESYGAHGFTGTDTGVTTIDNQGYTAIRVNLPPVGFNKARITLQIDGMPSPMDLIDLEVPAVVVIDPGHGGADGGAESISGNMSEAEVVLDVAKKIEPHIRQALLRISPNYKLLYTRKDNTFVDIAESNKSGQPGKSRQGMQKYNGADIFVSVHCNSGVSTARGVETIIQWGKVAFGTLTASKADQGNYNHPYDYDLAHSINEHVAHALNMYDAVYYTNGIATSKNMGVVRDDNERLVLHGPGVLRDSATSNGNNNSMTPAYHPLRSALVELEFISNQRGDSLLISGKGNPTDGDPGTWDAESVREDVASSLSDSIEEIIKR
jgi:N-acetylmuramoyl-L-alanine amidase